MINPEKRGVHELVKSVHEAVAHCSTRRKSIHESWDTFCDAAVDRSLLQVQVMVRVERSPLGTTT